MLGYDLLEKCQNGPKEVLDSTVSESEIQGMRGITGDIVVGC